LIIEISALDVEEQKGKLMNRLNDWIGENEQVDDILVIGIKI